MPFGNVTRECFGEGTMKERYRLLEEVARQADSLYQFETIQNDPEGAAEIMPDFNRAVEALRAFDKEHRLTLRD